MELMDHARHHDSSRRLLEEIEQQLAAADDNRALREKRPENRAAHDTAANPSRVPAGERGG